VEKSPENKFNGKKPKKINTPRTKSPEI